MYNKVLDKDSLPIAVSNIFRLNNYECQENIQVHGSQIDVIARAKGDPFAPNIYIEVTVSHVDNIKYALDLTKFTVVQREDPSSICLCISLEGFTAPVKERAKAIGIRTQTYHELLRSFEKFSPYIDKIIFDKSLSDFEVAYEEPLFQDAMGRNKATDWILEWAVDTKNSDNWIVVLGEYGTGKTALTRIIELRMIREYIKDYNRPLPVRIELRDFTRQFDARTLLHNFLDKNGLSHISIDFFFYLIRTRRIVLLLDGYDEMAQFLNVRERRACLSALADLASEGAKGILTSRPNYFSEEEELYVFEALYQNIQGHGYYLSAIDREYLDGEKRVDELLNKYILERFERYLRDLDFAQTLSLVKRKLVHDPAGQEVIISILRKVFRESETGVRSSLAGKPVIITYMLDLVENIKDGAGSNVNILTEWSVYKLILDQLMIRDQKRTPGILPAKRRQCLQKLAVILSKRDTPVAHDEIFHSIIDLEFKSELRFLDTDQKIVRRNAIFENLRGSSTLTRSEGVKNSGWMFSHNSLREYLTSELYITSALEGKFVEISTPITQVMRTFVISMNLENIKLLLKNLNIVWGQRVDKRNIGTYFTLLWDAIDFLVVQDKSTLRKILPSSSGGISLDNTKLKEIAFKKDITEDLSGSHFKGSDISEVIFKEVNLSDSDFSENLLDAVIFHSCDLSKCKFNASWIFECDFIDCIFSGADFRGLSRDSSIFIKSNKSRISLSGLDVLGYFAFNGALVDEIDEYFILKFHPKFDIVYKICEKLIEQRNRQEIGLVQKGAARKDQSLAQDFLDLLMRKSWTEYDRTMVAITNEGRGVLRDFVHSNKMPQEIASFLKSN